MKYFFAIAAIVAYIIVCNMDYTDQQLTSNHNNLTYQE